MHAAEDADDANTTNTTDTNDDNLKDEEVIIVVAVMVFICCVFFALYFACRATTVDAETDKSTSPDELEVIEEGKKDVDQ